MNSKSNLSKLGVKKSHRDSLKKNLLGDLIVFESMQTTKAKAKAVIPMFDKVLKIAKMGLSKRETERMLSGFLFTQEAISKLMDVLAKRYETEKSGLIKMYNLEPRKGDAAVQVRLMLKGYLYKDMGKSVKSKIKNVEVIEDKNNSGSKSIAKSAIKTSKSQIAGSANKAKVKSRSGI